MGLARRFRQQHELNQAAALKVGPYLSRTGWCITGDFPSEDISRLGDLVSADDLNADAIMTQYARSRVSPLDHEIRENWPERAPPVMDALAAHSDGRYALSVPVLLAQADGIAAEELGEGPYGKDQGQPRAREAYRSRIDTAIRRS